MTVVQFVSSLGEARQLPGVYVLEVDPPPPARSPGTDWVGYTGRFAWGPVNVVTVVDSAPQYLDVFSPGGLGYTLTGYRGLARTQQANLKIVRIGATGFGPPTSVTITPQGTPASTSYSYRVVAIASAPASATVNTLPSVAGSTTTGAATLNNTNFNRIAWTAPAGQVAGAGYRIYRTVGGATQGLIGTVAAGVVTFDDTGLAGDAASVPTQNTTAQSTASMILQGPNASPATVNLINVAAKYPGALGGQVTLVIAAADDAVSGHFNMTFTLGNEVEPYRNCSVIAGSVNLGDQSASKILAPLSAVTANLDGVTRPVNGTYVLGVAASNVASPVAGSDGISLATDYTGTADTGNAGLARFEGDPDVTIVCSDDSSNALRATVNGALIAHGLANGREVVITGDSGGSPAAAITDLNVTHASTYRAEQGIYIAQWAYVADESGALQLVPATGFVAGALAHMPRHLGTHWKDERNARYYRGISALEYTVGRANQILCKNVGVEVLVPTAGGSFAPKSGVTTSLVAGKTTVARRRLADFLARGIVDGQESYEGGPLDPVTRSEQLSRVKAFLQTLKDAAKKGEAAITEAIEDFSVATASSGADLAAGLHKIQVRVKSFATQDAIVFLLTVGPTVTIEEQSAVA